MNGLIHIYFGNGKGKTTAAVGLAVRAAGAGKKVLFVQFLKDGTSSELKLLSNISDVLVCPVKRNFFPNLTEKEKNETINDCNNLFDKTVFMANKNYDLIILDEILDVCNLGIIQETKLCSFLKNKQKDMEVVLTGHNPSEKIQSYAHYLTEMKKLKHPFDEGINARKGIEL